MYIDFSVSVPKVQCCHVKMYRPSLVFCTILFSSYVLVMFRTMNHCFCHSFSVTSSRVSVLVEFISKLFFCLKLVNFYQTGEELLVSAPPVFGRPVSEQHVYLPYYEEKTQEMTQRKSGASQDWGKENEKMLALACYCSELLATKIVVFCLRYS